MHIFVDSNILIRYLTGDSKNQSPIAKKLFQRAAKNEAVLHLNSLVLHEVTYVLEKVYNVSRNDISNKLENLLKLSNIQTTDLDIDQTIKALEDYKNSTIDFPDCVYKQIALGNSFKLASFDKHFQKLGLKNKNILEPKSF